ncbi:MAG TPA: hypothetical protein VFB13_00755 [Reyranella sp.]|jgi:hypothetical protein|nr:hypothetical protein [Reyranella sp.]
MAKKNYTVERSAVHHDGKAYPPGATLALEDDQAEPLLAVNAIKAPPADKKSEAAKQ